MRGGKNGIETTGAGGRPSACRRDIGVRYRGRRARNAWIVAGVWCVVAAYATWHFTRGAPDWNRDFPMIAMAALAFPGAALFLLGRAVVASMRSTKFGESTLELDVSPVTAGTALSGRVRVGPAITVGAKGTWTIQCQKTARVRPTGSAKTRTETRMLHEEVKTFVVANDVARVGLPFRFDIPANAPLTQAGNELVDWVLALDVDSGGIGAKMAFGFDVLGKN